MDEGYEQYREKVYTMLKTWLNLDEAGLADLFAKNDTIIRLNDINYNYNTMKPASYAARAIYDALPDTGNTTKTYFHVDDEPLCDMDRDRLARVLNDPTRHMEIYRSGEGQLINICGAHFNYNSFMATLRQLFSKE